jgi:hypothetical protein
MACAPGGSDSDRRIVDDGPTPSRALTCWGHDEPAIIGSITPVGTSLAGSNRVVTSYWNSVDKYTVRIDRAAGYCIAMVTIDDEKHCSVVSTYFAAVLHMDVWKLVNGVEAAVDDYSSSTSPADIGAPEHPVAPPVGRVLPCDYTAGGHIASASGP